LTLVAVVGAANAASSKKDRVREHASFTVTGGGTVDLTAQSGPNGENAKGVFEISFPASPGFNFTGTVTCLSVSGNTAVAGGIVTGGDEPVGSGFVQYMVDNAKPGDGADMSNTIPQATPPTTCPAFVPPETTVDHGDIVIIDAS
jgi:hypothetical protein